MAAIAGAHHSPNPSVRPAAPAGHSCSVKSPLTAKKAIWGPVERDGVSQFPIYADLGVDILEVALSWNEAAPQRPTRPRDPTDPAYRWPANLDAAVGEAARYGIEVALAVSGTPPWANGGRDPRWAPHSPRDYARFLAAASRRYPTVRHWMIWSEPNMGKNFQPLVPAERVPLHGRGLRGPRLYARMLDAAYVALKRVSSRNLVIGGMTWSSGTVRPRFFIKALRRPDGRPPRMDLYGHNPFSIRVPDLSLPPLGGAQADFGDLDRLAGWLDRDLRGANPAGGKLRLFLSEYSLPTDHPSFEFNFHVTRAVQAQWLAKALRTARCWSRIYTFGYLGLYDDEPRPDGLQAERGLITRSGERKPAYAAFERG
jgi:hypothetical protein